MRGVLLYAVRGALLWLCGGAAYVLHICTGTASHYLPSHRPFHILTPLPDMHSPCISQHTDIGIACRSYSDQIDFCSSYAAHPRRAQTPAAAAPARPACCPPDVQPSNSSVTASEALRCSARPWLEARLPA